VSARMGLRLRTCSCSAGQALALPSGAGVRPPRPPRPGWKHCGASRRRFVLRHDSTACARTRCRSSCMGAPSFLPVPRQSYARVQACARAAACHELHQPLHVFPPEVQSRKHTHAAVPYRLTLCSPTQQSPLCTHMRLSASIAPHRLSAARQAPRLRRLLRVLPVSFRC